MSFNKFFQISQKSSLILILLATFIGGGLILASKINAQQISGGWGQSYWNANFSNPGWGNFSGPGGVGEGGGGLSEADLKLIVEALIDPLFKNGNIDFETALRSSIPGQAVYEKMMNTNPEYYQSFMDYVSTDKNGREAALNNIGNLIDPAKLLEGDLTVDVELPNPDVAPDYVGLTEFVNSVNPARYTASQWKEIYESFGFVQNKTGTWIDPSRGDNVVATHDPSNPANTIDVNDEFVHITDPCFVGYDVGLPEFSERSGSGSGPSVPGVPSTPANTVCTSYTYNDWGACGGGVQTRSILHQYPSGCTDTSSAVLTQNCTMGSIVCTSYTYSDWGACVDNQQTRAIASKSPSNCTDTSSAVFTQSCISPISPIITNTTDAEQTSSRPLLSVITDRAATCRYNENGGFTYPAGTTFDTTGGYNHNVQLPDSANGLKTYYVVCKDNATGGMSDAMKVEFAVNVDSAPVVTSVTPATQTGDNPVLAVITDRLAACQYQKDNAFTYGAGTPMTTADNYSHSASIAALADGTYSFYVICKNNDTGAISQPKQISTTLQRTTEANAPVVTNTTAISQVVNNPVLSVSTNIGAVCQYQKDVQFTYGQGTQFISSNNLIHNAQLSGLADGAHTYYVVCKNASINAYSAPMAIMFVVDAGTSGVCANLVSNDRKNNANRSYWNNPDSNSVYLWQAVETGTRDKFDSVDWYAGYQFTPEEDGRINRLCGYFESGVTNRVSVYNGSYDELAGVEIVGNGSWECANITPVEIKTDRRYYAIARIEDNPVYFEYKSGMLPKNTNNVIIEAGIRQLAGSGVFDTEIRKYDYMIFGLVDVQVSWTPETITGPVIVSAGPDGTINDSSATLSVRTSGASDCRFGREDVPYGQMSYAMAGVSTDDFAQKVCDLENGDHTFYVRCKSTSGAENNVSTAIQFTITQ